jgi:sec-independent protein translocase protein TatA
MGELSPWHWAIVIVIFVVLFGAKRLPDAARSLGRSARILKAELHGDSPKPAGPVVADPAEAPAGAPTAAPPTAAPPMAGAVPDVPSAPVEPERQAAER